MPREHQKHWYVCPGRSLSVSNCNNTWSSLIASASYTYHSATVPLRIISAISGRWSVFAANIRTTRPIEGDRHNDLDERDEADASKKRALREENATHLQLLRRKKVAARENDTLRTVWGAVAVNPKVRSWQSGLDGVDALRVAFK